MRVPARTREADRLLTKRAAGGIAPGVAEVLSAVEEAAEGASCGAVPQRSWPGSVDGAAVRLTALLVAEPASGVVCKQPAHRSRPPGAWIAHDGVDDRPGSSSFPSGHTAAAVAFTAVALCAERAEPRQWFAGARDVWSHAGLWRGSQPSAWASHRSGPKTS